MTSAIAIAAQLHRRIDELRARELFFVRFPELLFGDPSPSPTPLFLRLPLLFVQLVYSETGKLPDWKSCRRHLRVRCFTAEGPPLLTSSCSSSCFYSFNPWPPRVLFRLQRCSVASRRKVRCVPPTSPSITPLFQCSRHYCARHFLFSLPDGSLIFWSLQVP